MTLNVPVSDRWTHDVWLNGQFVPPSDALVPVMVHGLHYGTGVFEGIRFYAGKAFLLEQHMDRLLASARAIGLDVPFDSQTLCDVANELIARSGLADGYLRPIAWFGDGGLGLHAKGLAADVALVVWEWPKVFQPESGVALNLSKARRATPDTLPPQAKTTGGYLLGFMAHRQARSLGFDDCLINDCNGTLAETSSANFFAVIDAVLVTPKADLFLNGLTRQTVISIAKDLGIGVQERRLTADMVPLFTEAFITGTAVEITPVTKIETHQMPIGALTARLQAAYKKQVG